MNDKEITVLLIPNMERPRTLTIKNTLKAQQVLVDGLIEIGKHFDDDVILVCNEEGNIIGKAPNRAVYNRDKEIETIIFGDFYLCRSNGENFTSLNKEDIQKYKKLFKYPEQFLKINGEIVAVPIKSTKDLER